MLHFCFCRSVISVVKHTLSVREVWGSTTGQVESAQCRQWFYTATTFLGSCVARRKASEMSPAARYTLRRNTASIMKIDFFFVN